MSIAQDKEREEFEAFDLAHELCVARERLLRMSAAVRAFDPGGGPGTPLPLERILGDGVLIHPLARRWFERFPSGATLHWDLGESFGYFHALSLEELDHAYDCLVGSWNPDELDEIPIPLIHVVDCTWIAVDALGQVVLAYVGAQDLEGTLVLQASLVEFLRSWSRALFVGVMGFPEGPCRREGGRLHDDWLVRVPIWLREIPDLG